MITIIGAGKVGGGAALFSALRNFDDQILLLDIVEGLPQGEAMDINHVARNTSYLWIYNNYHKGKSLKMNINSIENYLTVH